MNNFEIRNHIMINDGLNELAANAVEITIDRSTGIIYAVYLSSETTLGESSHLVKLAKFNIMQPTNIQWTTVFDFESDFWGHRLSECNIIELNSTTVRVFALDLDTKVYYYKDVKKKTLAAGSLNEVKFKAHINAPEVSLSLENINSFLVSRNNAPIEHFDMTTSIAKVGDCFYSIVCGKNIETPLFIKSENGAVWTFESAINHKADYEAMLCYHNSKFWVLCRDGFENETTEIRQNLMYSDDGITWKQSNLSFTPSDTRPYLFSYQGDLYLAYSTPMNQDYSTVRPWRCNIHVGKITTEDGKEAFEEIIYKQSKFGIVYYALLDWNGYMVMLYSSGEMHPTEGLIFGCSSGKDCLNYTVLHSQEPILKKG